MNRTVELDKAEREVKDTELKLFKLKSALKDVEEEIKKLLQIETQLAENINFLKVSGAAVMADQYKKAKEDLVRTRGRLAMISIDRDRISKSLGDCDTYLVKAKNDLAKAILGKDNVLSFKRKKDGG